MIIYNVKLPLGAVRTCVRSRTGVRAHVKRKAVRHAERLAADLARVRFFPCDTTLF